MIRAEGVTKIFGPDPESVLPLVEQGKTKSEIQAQTGHVLGISNASFELRPGEVFCIMGLSGSGKSTLIRCINRLIEPTSGKIYLVDEQHGEREITGMDANELRELRKHDMSMVFQHFALFPHRTVLSNVIYGLEIQGRERKESERIGQEVLELVGLGQWSHSYPHELSGGMQQRVGLARGLATEAKVLLMDEPFSALDPLIKVNMQQELMRIQDELQRTILFITHDLDEAMRIGDHIAIMDDGEIVQIGTPEEILVNPRTEYVANFVEHADPTGVLTAGTIARPLGSTDFEWVGEADGLKLFARRGEPDIRFGIDPDGRLGKVYSGEQAIQLRDLHEVLERPDTEERPERRSDLALHCDEGTVLRDLLRGRSHATLPTIVTAADGRLRGIIDEPDLINGILEKRGQGETPEQYAGESRAETG
ncbi:glycine betaine/L-proline ABC transporter ATP-binding protein [Aquisalimonas sp.]|uniref:quaternary amine ABC transporter ATP-binding protein n=1 Tax=Aquisalimonas sp. TaxID=1872621 RepID=UPI0025B97FF6|nr:glycine betaine/L-proline ABC transporter ATP-binding protein [Aquisalimonas sp.]